MTDDARAAWAPPTASKYLTELDVLALTLHHEANGEGVLGMTAVGCVIRNRVDWGKWGKTVRDVCLYPMQFSCWIPAGGRVNYSRLQQHADAIRAGSRPPSMVRAYEVASALLGGGQEDVTNEADHYYAPKAMRPVDAVPKWARGLTPVAQIGAHTFYRLRTRPGRLANQIETGQA